MSNHLTKRQRDVLDYIQKFMEEHHYSPTIAEIAKGLYTSRSFVSECLVQLKEKGCLTFEERKSRTIVLTGKSAI